MDAVILVGGKGTRLLPLTCNTPKPMVPVLNRPFMEYVVRRLSGYGAGSVVMAMSYLPEAIEKHFGDGDRFGSRIRYAVEETPMNTAGAVKNCEKYLSDAFFVLNGDIFTDLDLSGMVRFHREHGAKLTIALTPVADPSAYGLVETGPDGRIRRFLEKPKPEEITTNMINAGTYILEPEMLDFIPPRTNFSFERQLFPLLLEKGIPVYGYPSDAYWIDIGTPAKYFQLNQDLMAKQRGTPGGVIIGEGSEVHPSATTKGTVVVGPGCVIDEGALVEDSIIWQGGCLESGVRLRKSILAGECRLGAGSLVESAVFGDGVSVGSGVRLGAGSKIWAGSVVRLPSEAGA